MPGAGFEPAAFWSRTKRATKLRYTSKSEPTEGLEPSTCGLRNRCSTDWATLAFSLARSRIRLTRRDYIRIRASCQYIFYSFHLFTNFYCSYCILQSNLFFLKENSNLYSFFYKIWPCTRLYKIHNLLNTNRLTKYIRL